MSAHPPGAEAVTEEIVREFARVHEFYDHSDAGVEVTLHPNFVAVMTDIELTRVEETLVGSGDAGSAEIGREALQAAAGDALSAIVERATGRRVVTVACRVVLDEGAPPWQIEIFRLGKTPANA